MPRCLTFYTAAAFFQSIDIGVHTAVPCDLVPDKVPANTEKLVREIFQPLSGSYVLCEEAIQ